MNFNGIVRLTGSFNFANDPHRRSSICANMTLCSIQLIRDRTERKNDTIICHAFRFCLPHLRANNVHLSSLNFRRCGGRVSVMIRGTTIVQGVTLARAQRILWQGPMNRKSFRNSGTVNRTFVRFSNSARKRETQTHPWIGKTTISSDENGNQGEEMTF